MSRSKKSKKKQKGKKKPIAKSVKAVVKKQPKVIEKKKITLKMRLLEYKKQIFSFDHKGWNIAVLMIAAIGAIGIQSFMDTKMNPETAQANIAYSQTSASEAYKIFSTHDIIDTEKSNRGHFIAPGETDIIVYSFGIQSGSENILLKELRLNKIGNIDDKYFIKAVLYEGENAIATSRMQNGELYFRRFTSVLQPDTYKDYYVKLDLSEEAKVGARFKFEISNPYSFRLLINDQPVYALDTYPLDGAYVTIVGWR